MKKLQIILLLMFVLFVFAGVVLAQDEDSSSGPSGEINADNAGLLVTEEALPEEISSNSHYRQGYLFYQDGDFQSAEKEYEKSLNQDPQNAKALYWLAKTQYELGKYNQAEKNVVSALKLNSQIEGASNLLRTLRRKAKDLAYKAKPKVEVQSNINNKVTLDLVNVPAASALKLFAEETGLNLIVDKDVYGTVTIHLKNATPSEALDSILAAADATFIQQGSTIRVFASGEPPDIIKVAPGRYIKSFNINYATPANLQTTLANLVGSDTQILVTKDSSKLVVEGDMKSIKRIGALLRTLDTPPKQVLVEANIIQVNHSNASKLAANLKYTSPANPSEITKTTGLAGDSSASAAQGFYYNVTTDNMEAVIEALQTKTGYNLLSSPKVLALDGKSAEIITGSRLGYKVSTVTTTGLIESIEFLDVGTKLTITPSIKSDGYIMMEIHPEISEGSIVNELPQKNSTETTTKLLVKDGQTIIIGGLIKDLAQETKTGVPILADIPFLGALFRKNETTVTKNEFIILIRPRIVDAAFLAEMGTPVSELNKKRLETKPSLPLGLFR